MTAFADDPQFCRLLAGRSDVDLVPLMLELAADAYPQLDRKGCLKEIDRLAAACRAAVERTPSSQISARLRAVGTVLYRTEGFHGNRDAYYEPENSYLNQVLARRTGLPISLGILYMAVASRAGLRMFGTNTPGHFMIGCLTLEEPLFIDAFNNGDILELEDCRLRIVEMTGKPMVIADEYFRPASAADIVTRVLRNLKAAYTMRDDWPSQLPVQRRLTALLPTLSEEHRNLGLVALRAGAPGEALAALEACAKLSGGELDAETHQSLRIAQRMVAELN